ncbi:TIGR01777 family protein [Kribbella sp. ALI-6-A]|uniref:TIGR01777 family oxidoreductase n=1 Tax=Kribbella sp. ALI-6-A TaxID=1933817 RepID=UPI00097C9BDA|nr:TIGR01777 family oxidoreductase [Kribbella sp. ALI-6-A]ONI74323.1 TIGR01777 family protein [Kribbella sp. ALI-6-A]
MGLSYSSIVAAPRDEVFGWHERPGAIERLTPPWMPVRIKQETDDLGAGRAVLGFPFGLDWVAQHRDCVPPDHFVDELTSAPLRWAVNWRHTHQFDAVGNDTTRITDRIDSNVPGFLLRSMLAYRHQQFADDLAALRRAQALGLTPQTVAVTGSHGTVGRSLVALLGTAGHTVIKLVRGEPSGPNERKWNPADPAEDLLNGVEAVVHLAGASIAGRFTESHRRAIVESRIGPTRALASLAARRGVRTFVCASAIGYYGPDRGDEVLTEQSDRGDGFLAEVVENWERATDPARDGGVRVVNIRTGLVQTPAGGVLRLQYPMFAAGLGGPLASGNQWQPWIGIDDLLDIYHRALYDDRLTGPVNGVGPDPVRNRDYTTTLARVVRRPAVFRVPSFGPRILLGDEGAKELAEASQRVVPAVLDQLGHTFRHPTLEPALRHVLGKP